jgi:DNA-binding NarL/FixJ family response regulator
MNAFRILVADDHPIFRLGLCSLLVSHIGWEVCGEAADGQDALEKCIDLKPDLVILDIYMPKLNGVDAARQILKDNPAQRILILTDIDCEKMVRDCLRAGVRGRILKSDGTGNLTTAVEALQRHKCFFSQRVSDLLLGDSKRNSSDPTAAKVLQLTPREREVLQFLASGQRCKDVAAVLNISVKTVETHRSNMMFKLNLHSIAQLVLYAVRHEIIHVQSQMRLRSPNAGMAYPTLPARTLARRFIRHCGRSD